jgi:hypothetical protein
MGKPNTIEKFIKQVTLTGADDSIDYHQLFELSAKYPFIEWGILLSKNSEGYSRFPTWKWIEGMITEKPASVNVSGHLCGSWVRDIVVGGSMFVNSHGELAQEFNRFQLNFHGQLHIACLPDDFIEALFNLTALRKQQIIFQNDDVNERLYHLAHSQYAKHKGIDAVALHDISGGAGILPQEWPLPMGDYCGYAGGLSPDNLLEQIELIQSRIRNKDNSLYPIWIDAETHLRSNDDQQFDISKIIKFIEIAKPYVRE